jgi:hypothetical protein
MHNLSIFFSNYFQAQVDETINAINDIHSSFYTWFFLWLFIKMYRKINNI